MILSDLFDLMLRVHQRCPLSMSLYIIGAKVPAIFIDADMKIKRVQIGNPEMKILNFADGTIIFLRDNNSLLRV